MRIEEGYIYFDSLVQPSRDVVGEYSPIKAKVPSFSQKNALGNIGEIDDFYQNRAESLSLQGEDG